MTQNNDSAQFGHDLVYARNNVALAMRLLGISGTSQAHLQRAFP